MAEEIVACPGCGKKFKIPEGAPGGTFQCTACNATVPYGRAAAPAKGAARGAAAQKPSGPARGGRAAAAAPSKPAAARAGARRRGREEPEEEEVEERGRRGRGKSKAKDQQTVLWISLAAIALVGGGAAVVAMQRKDPEPAAPPKPAPTATEPAAPAPADPGTAAAPAAPAPAAAPATSPSADPAKPPETSGIGGAKVNAPASSLALDALLVRIDDVGGITPQEREVLDKDVALVVDFDAGRAGNQAADRLRKRGRVAVPALLSAFEAQWKRSKWETKEDKWASFQVQQILVQITKADRPGGDFVARYVPQDHTTVPATDFQRAARMWVNWWNNTGKSIEKFKDFAE